MPKSQKKIVKPGSIKAEKHILRRITAKKMKFYIDRKRKHSFFADTKLQVDQIKIKNSGKVQTAIVYLKIN